VAPKAVKVKPLRKPQIKNIRIMRILNAVNLKLRFLLKVTEVKN
jgi:hypothetical protein